MGTVTESPTGQQPRLAGEPREPDNAKASLIFKHPTTPSITMLGQEGCTEELSRDPAQMGTRNSIKNKQGFRQAMAHVPIGTAAPHLAVALPVGFIAVGVKALVHITVTRPTGGASPPALWTLLVYPRERNSLDITTIKFLALLPVQLLNSSKEDGGTEKSLVTYPGWEASMEPGPQAMVLPCISPVLAVLPEEVPTALTHVAQA